MKQYILTPFLLFMLIHGNAQSKSRDYCITNGGNKISGNIIDNMIDDSIQYRVRIKDSLNIIHEFFPADLKAFFIHTKSLGYVQYEPLVYNKKKLFLQHIAGNKRFKKCYYFYEGGYSPCNINAPDVGSCPNIVDSILYFKNDSLLPQITKEERKSKSEIGKNINAIKDSAIVYIEHTSLMSTTAASPIYCDSDFIGSNKRISYMYVILKPGIHTFSCPFPLNNKFSYTLDVKAGGVYYLKETCPVLPFQISFPNLKFTLLNSKKGIKDLNKCTLSEDNVYLH